ncbi:aldo-keto reductase family 1 member C15 [Hyalella azteca]|uniref:Aldo-keto reductase family 1 member C15 n=1 Tax=Hyalella azteca TaxID=294128 RepID=A0A8B7PR10_HYAAZ|nr:aldo-keto reductase family 1 member C15 [Hyalella azteca]
MAAEVVNGTHVKLNDGNLMPLLGLGTWQAAHESVTEAVRRALEAGYRHIDTAYSYMNEEAVGEGIRRWGGDRQEVFVTTKLPLIAMGGGRVEKFLRKSLKKLELEYVDLFYAAHESVTEAVRRALETGYRHIDTAYSYLNEEAVGEGIRRWGGDRREVFVTTKLPLIAMGGGRVEKFLRKSLKKLELEYVDLFLLHCPFGLLYRDDDTLHPLDADGNLVVDYATDHVALWKEMEAVRDLGLAKSIGVSNFGTAQLRRLFAIAKIPPAVNQLEMHAEFQQPDMVEYSRQTGLVLTSYATLGSPGRKGTPFGVGIVIPSLLDHPVVRVISELTNKTSTRISSNVGIVIPSLLDHPVVRVISELTNKTPAQVLLRYFVQQGIVVIPKSVTPARITENAQVFGWQLPASAMDALRTLDRGEEARSFMLLRTRGFELHAECPVTITTSNS